MKENVPHRLFRWIRANGLRILGILAGSCLTAVSINVFLAPHQFLSGGVSGVALIGQYALKFPAAFSIVLLNLPIFLWGYRSVDRDFALFSVFGTLALSLFISRTQWLTAHVHLDDPMLSALFGGALGGFGGGVVFRSRGSMGGVDIVAAIVKRRFSISLGTTSLALNAAVVLAGGLVFGLSPALYTLVSMAAAAAVTNRTLEGLDRKKSVFIITSHENDVAGSILTELNRGVTYLSGQGAYTGSSRNVIYCIVTINQLAKVKHIVRSIDPEAFMAVSDTAEVLGRGFRQSAL